MAKSLVLQVNVTAGLIPACGRRLSHDIAAIYSLIPLPPQGLLGSYFNQKFYIPLCIYKYKFLRIF